MGTVTVNGKPLEEHIGEELGAEIRQIRNEELDGTTWRKPLVSRVHRNHSKERTSPGEVVYKAGQRETHVLIAGMEFPWHVKAPFVRSGMSVLGAIELDKEADLVKCHECGEWKQSLGRHAATAHRITSKQYRIKHGLGCLTHLTSPKYSEYQRSMVGTKNLRPIDPSIGRSAMTVEKKSDHAKHRQLMGKGFSHSPETANLRGKCKAQLTQGLKRMAESLGRTPTAAELAKGKLYPQTIASVFGQPLAEVMLSLGITPRGVGKRARRVS